MQPNTEPSPARHLDDAIREVDLPSASSHTWEQLDTTTSAYSSRTLVKQPHVRVVLIALERGGHIPGHRAEGDITVQVLSGRIRFRVGGQIFELGRGRLLAVAAGIPHDLSALEDSDVLLTIATR